MRRTETIRVLATALLAIGLVAVAPQAPAAADASDAWGAPEAFRSLAGGQAHTCHIDPAGVLRCWGDNGSGQLGLGGLEDIGDDPGEVGDLFGVDLGTGRRAIAVAAGDLHSCALLDTGQVKCWGEGSVGRLGYGTTHDRGDGPGEMGDDLPAVALGTGRTATAIAAGESHTCAVLDTGQVRCWGSNDLGQLGLGDTQTRGDGPGEMGNNLPTVALGAGRTATAISTRGPTTCALLDTGRIKCWGNNVYGQLGLGDTEGRGDEPGEMGNNLPTVALGTGLDAVALSVGRQHVCAILDSAELKCWGDGFSGRLGSGATDAIGDGPGEMGDALAVVPSPSGAFPRGVAADYAHTCALYDNGNVKCWGDNSNGRLGLGETEGRGDQPGEMGDALPYVDLGGPAAAVTTSEYGSCALFRDQTVKCWGANSQNAAGSLGLGDTEDRLDEPGEGGSSLPVVPVIPQNDDWAFSNLMSGAQGSLVGTNANAGTEAGEPAHAGFPAADSSVWYQWTPTASGPVVIDTFGSDFDTVLGVYGGFSVDALTEVAANDDSNASLQSQVRFNAGAGLTYDIAVAGFNSGSGRIQLRWRQALPCDGQPVTVALAFGDVPTAGADVIRGTAGNDTINGLAGADRICGDAGADTITGGAGPDIDRIFGEGGNDTLRGGAGNDRLDGGNQNDRLIGDGGIDNLNGQAGTDNLQGGTGADRLNGGTQRDTCDGGPQADTHSACEVRTSIP